MNTLVIIFWLIFAIIGAIMADHRNRSTVGWALICALTSLIGILVLALLGTKKEDAR